MTCTEATENNYYFKQFIYKIYYVRSAVKAVVSRQSYSLPFLTNGPFNNTVTVCVIQRSNYIPTVSLKLRTFSASYGQNCFLICYISNFIRYIEETLLVYASIILNSEKSFRN